MPSPDQTKIGMFGNNNHFLSIDEFMSRQFRSIYMNDQLLGYFALYQDRKKEDISKIIEESISGYIKYDDNPTLKTLNTKIDLDKCTGFKPGNLYLHPIIEVMKFNNINKNRRLYYLNTENENFTHIIFKKYFIESCNNIINHFMKPIIDIKDIASHYYIVEGKLKRREGLV